MKDLYKSLANFQQEVPIIHKGTEGYGYSYADLPAIFEIINPLLKKHGLGFTQIVNNNILKTIVFHIETGDILESEMEIIADVKLAKMNELQVLGSQITYLRRYSLSAMLGIVTDKDNDANGGKQEPEKEKPKTVWLTDEQFAIVIKSDLKGLQATVKKYSTELYKMKNIHKDAISRMIADLSKKE